MFLQTDTFFELMSLSLSIRLITGYSVQIVCANRLTLFDATDCCEIQRWFCQFLEKTDISVCLPFISGSLGVKLCKSGEINRTVVRRSYHP